MKRSLKRSLPLLASSHHWRALSIGLLVFTSACGQKDSASTPSSIAARGAIGGGALSKERAAPELAAVAPSSAPAQDVALQPSNAANASAAAIVAPTMVIRNGSASIEVDSLEIAIEAVRKLATSLGGYVGNTTLTAGAFSVRSAELQLRIPAGRYEDAVGSLAPIGKVESQVSSAEDVGEEFVDVTARQANARRLEERLVSLLATRTGKLEDVLAVERELARVREEIERYEGRLRYLKSNVATSTLSVTVHERKPVVSQYPGRNIIVESFKNAWTNFVQFTALLISSLGWLVPLCAIIAGVLFAVKRYSAKAAPTNKTE
jgi:hypothetical protein